SLLHGLSKLPASRLPLSRPTRALPELLELFRPSRYRLSQTDDYPEFAYLARNAAQRFRQMNLSQSATKEFRELIVALDDWANALEPQPRKRSRRQRQRSSDTHNFSSDRNVP